MNVDNEDFVLAKVSKDDIVFVSDDGETRELKEATKFQEATNLDEFSYITVENARTIIKRQISLEG